MGKSDYYADGDYNAICDQCGMKYKKSKLRKQWNNLLTCPTCFDYRHPQEFVRGVRDDQSVIEARPDVPPTFTEGAQELPMPPQFPQD
jgi:hypothetical protein